MIFNLGMTNLKNVWKKLNAAINDENWAKAAEECERGAPISSERNDYVRGLLKTAAKAKSDRLAKEKAAPAASTSSKAKPGVKPVQGSLH